MCCCAALLLLLLRKHQPCLALPQCTRHHQPSRTAQPGPRLPFPPPPPPAQVKRLPGLAKKLLPSLAANILPGGGAVSLPLWLAAMALPGCAFKQVCNIVQLRMAAAGLVRHDHKQAAGKKA